MSDNEIKAGDRVKMQLSASTHVGTVDAVFPAGTPANGGKPWAWVKWDGGGEGAPTLDKLEKSQF